MNDLRKSFLRDFGRRIGWGAPKPWGAAPRRAGFSPHSQRLEREAAENVARGRQTRGQAQGALDRSFAQQPAETRAAPTGAAAQGFGGAGFTGGVSRKLGQAPSRAWVAPKPPPINPPMAKVTSVPADTTSYPPSNGDALMDGAHLRELIARETATPLGKAHFENIMDGLDAVAVAFAQKETRPAAMELLAKWMGEDQPALRKALSGAWLGRAKGMAKVPNAFLSRAGRAVEAGVLGGVRAYDGGATHARNFGIKINRKLGQRAAVRRGAPASDASVEAHAAAGGRVSERLYHNAVPAGAAVAFVGAGSLVAPKPPRPPPLPPRVRSRNAMAKATSVPADTTSYPPSNGDALMDDAQLRELIARETASPLGKAHFENIMDGLDAVAVAFAQPQTRPAAMELLAKWMGEDQPALRKALSGAWLGRAKGVLEGAGKKIKGGYLRGADKAQAFGSKVGARLAEGSKEGARARYEGGKRAQDAVENRIVWDSPSRGQQYQGAKEAGSKRANDAFVAPAAARGGRVGRAAYHGAVGAVGAGAVGAAGAAAYAGSGRRRDEAQNQPGLRKGLAAVGRKIKDVYRAGEFFSARVGMNAGAYLGGKTKGAGKAQRAAYQDASDRSLSDSADLARNNARNAKDNFARAGNMEAEARKTFVGKTRVMFGSAASGESERTLNAAKISQAEAKRYSNKEYIQELAHEQGQFAARDTKDQQKSRGALIGGAVGILGYRGAVGAAGAGAAIGVGSAAFGGSALSEAEIEQRRNAAKARWAGHSRMQQGA